MRPPFTPRTRRRLAVLAVAFLVGLVAAAYNSRGHLEGGVATTHVMIDYPGPSIVDRRALPQDVSTLQKHAELYARVLTSSDALDAVAKRAGIQPSQLSGVARLTAAAIAFTQPDSEQRASQIVASWAPYRLELQSDRSEPILAIYAAAPSPAAAAKLADSAVSGLHDYLVALARRQGYDPAELPQFRQLGETRGDPINTKAKYVIAIVTFVTGFGITAALLFAALALLRRRYGMAEPPAPPAGPRPLDDWPHTNRLLPWTLAAFITILWLTPFDRIQLSFHTPIDMKLDRLLLPFVFLVWGIAWVSGGHSRPRLRLTWIHAAVGAFIGVAFLSVVIDARYLNQTMELMLSLKKLPLLLSYASVFWIMSTSIRPTEVRAFMKLTGILGVIVGIGIIYEYRLDTNIFSFVMSKVLVHPFVLLGDSSAADNVDSLGRRGITGPTAAGLEAVAVLAFALPVLVVSLLSARERKPRALYAAGICIIVAASFATGRKSGLLAPLAVLAALVYFRRRELLSLAPVGLVMALAVSILSPGAVHGIIEQFSRPDSGSVATTSDRVSDYDAIRPDVWTHFLFGRGFGSYNHETYRVLDSQILTSTIETGVIGLIAFLLVGAAVILAARRTINRRESPYASVALMGAACAAAFVVVSALFDELGFPHATYIFLYMAGLVSVVVGRGVPEDPLPEALPPPLELPHEVPVIAYASPAEQDALV